MRFLNSIPMVPIIPTYTPPSSSAPKHASADIVIPTSDSPLFSGLMDESEEEDHDNSNSGNNRNNKGYGQEDGYESAPTPAEEIFVRVMSLQEAQMAVARLRQFASVQGQGLQGTMHSLDVIEQELGVLSGMANREI
ncbi:hypothetical protein CPC16_003078 [Podila verticillata]|nr:hypothetical protein CPC16_003078 [Podila verticillata]